MSPQSPADQAPAVRTVEWRVESAPVDYPQALAEMEARTAAIFEGRNRDRYRGPGDGRRDARALWDRSEEHTSELQLLMRISYAVFCLKKKNITIIHQPSTAPSNTL